MEVTGGLPVVASCGIVRVGASDGVAKCRRQGLWSAARLCPQRRLPEGLVLLAPEQHPEQARELARCGDDRDLVTATQANTLVEGVQTGPGLRTALQLVRTMGPSQ